MLSFLTLLWHRLLAISLQFFKRCEKFILRLITGKCELVRICSSPHPMSVNSKLAFARSLKCSKQLYMHNKIIFQDKPKPFSVSSTLDFIIKTKMNINNTPKLVLSNMTSCLQSLRYVNMVISTFEKRQKQEFQETDPLHVQLLESLWSCLKPQQRRNASDTDSLLNSSDWGLIGFQGRNPTTDLRGMGMLGLIQLEYFSRNRSKDAQAILLESNHPRRFFPFAATGINITAFFMELCNNFHYHAYLMHVMEKKSSSSSSSSKINAPMHEDDDSSSSSSSSSQQQQQQQQLQVDSLVIHGQDALHDEYCRLYMDFCRLWVERDPLDCMAFPAIFAEFKSRVKKNNPRIL